jgi:lysine-N-methylase
MTDATESTQRDDEVRPTYAAAFRCLGPACEDDCCHEWDLPLDSRTYTKYKQFPVQKLGAVVSEFVKINPVGVSDGLFAQINKTSEGACPFFGADHLCGIQKEYGAELLSASCSIYPRSLSMVEGELEGALSLSCPEAARNVLLTPDFMGRRGNLFSGEFRTDNHFHLASDRNGSPQKPAASYLATRGLILRMVRDRTRSIWQRLVAIGALCRKMDGMAETEGFVDVESQPRLKLEIVFEFTDALMRGGSSKRFQTTFWNFVEGIGSDDPAATGDDVSRFLEAEEKYYRPFFSMHPFPYGRSGSAHFTSRGIFQEFVQLATRFAWIETLLIGIAGHYREAFAVEHVVYAVQSFTRSVEHYPDLLDGIDAVMKRRGLDNLMGMAALLKN